MTDPIRQGLSRDLHGIALGQENDDLLCDYHGSLMAISTDNPVLLECIRIIDPQLDGYRDDKRWQVDVARCSSHATTDIEPATFGYEEALIRVPIAISNGIASIAAPDKDDIAVLGFSSAAEGYQPMMIDERLRKVSEPTDYGYARWIRVANLLDTAPAPVRSHVQHLIERSSEIPFDDG